MVELEADSQTRAPDGRSQPALAIELCQNHLVYLAC
jgi:hypothetical protein